MTGNAYDRDLDRNPANFQPLTPLVLLERAAKVFPEEVAIIHGNQSRRRHARLVSVWFHGGDTAIIHGGHTAALVNLYE